MGGRNTLDIKNKPDVLNTTPPANCSRADCQRAASQTQLLGHIRAQFEQYEHQKALLLSQDRDANAHTASFAGDVRVAGKIAASSNTWRINSDGSNLKLESYDTNNWVDAAKLAYNANANNTITQATNSVVSGTVAA